MRSIPYGTRYLIVTCSEISDAQFRGIHQAGDLLGRSPLLLKKMWNGEAIELNRRRVLKWVLVSGHGADEKARLSDGRNNALTPRHLSLPQRCKLYLLGCYQGKEKLRSQWALATGCDPSHVYGCRGETESALSTLFLLNILDDGLDRADYWFQRWIEVNDYLRSWFPQMRNIYRENQMNFLSSLQSIARRVDLAPIEDFIRVGTKHPDLLSALGPMPWTSTMP